MRSLISLVLLVCLVSVSEAGTCSGRRITPVRNVVGAVHGLLHRTAHAVHDNAVARRMHRHSHGTCGHVQAPSCAGLGVEQTAPQPEYKAPVVIPTPVSYHSEPIPQVQNYSVAQQKSEVQASQGRMYHIGGSFGAGNKEGVGFSTVSPQHAIQSSCYWGQCTPVDIGVARGNNGWYATVLYQ